MSEPGSSTSSRRRMLAQTAIASVVASLAIGAASTVIAVQNPQVTDFAGIDATRHVQTAALGCEYSRPVQAAGALLIAGSTPMRAGGELPWHFNEPPVMSLLALPFQSLRIGTAVDLWEIATWVAIVACGIAFWRQRGAIPAWLAAAVGAALLLNFTADTNFSLAQDDALLLLGALAALQLLRHRRDVAAGALFGLLFVKPQLMFLVFATMIIQRRWRAASSCAATAGVLAVASVAMVGADCTGQWLASATRLTELEIGMGIPSSVARATGSTLLSDAVFAALAAGCVALLYGLRSRLDTAAMAAVGIGLAVIIGLHTLTYDVILLAPLGIEVARSRPWAVVLAGWAFSVAQLIDNAYAPLGLGGFAPVRATEAVPSLAVLVAVSLLARPKDQRELRRITQPDGAMGIVSTSPG